MYSCPSASKTREPRARSMMSGSPPTARKARTGLLTPPTRIFSARAKRSEELVTVESYTHGTESSPQRRGENTDTSRSENRRGAGRARTRRLRLAKDVRRARHAAHTERQERSFVRAAHPE